MISQNELQELMEKEIPELSKKLQENESYQNAYQVVHHLLDYTNSKVKEQNYKAAKQCFTLAEKIYNKGNKAVKNAIENVYVFSFSHLLFNDEGKRRVLISLMPGTLFTLYVRQVMNSHI